MPTFSRNLEQSLHRALALANERHHEYATLEHLLLALIDDQDAAAVMRACNVDLDKLKRNLGSYLESELENLVTDGGDDSKPTAGFQRVIQRAVIHVQSSGREEVTGANVLVAIFAERESHAAYFLQEQDMTRYDAVNYISHGIAKRAGHVGVAAGARQRRRGRREGRQRRRAEEKGRCARGLLRQPQQEGEGRQDRSADRPRRARSTAASRCCAAARRTIRCSSATPASARPRSPKAWRAASSTARCRTFSRTRRCSRSTWARCSPAPAIAATSRSASSRSSRRSRPIRARSCSSTRSTP